MKSQIKLLAAIAFTGLSFTNLQAQTNSTDGSHFGIKGGVNFSNIYSTEVDDNNVLTSFNAGVYGTFPVGDILSIQPEILYSRKGGELKYDNAITTGTAQFKLNYIEVPLLLKVNATDNISFHAGPYFAYLIDAEVNNDASGDALDFEDAYDNDDFNKFDIGISAGIGFDFNSIGFGARYNYGFSTIGKERDFAGETYTIPDGKNSNISLYLSYKLN
ncbi:porin family protein [Flavobacterium aquicola]|uniref:Outer membrane protein with beta-barrel domain n=1 Tax=Flavobacterium aquicola TaxID=1682742 RepID=A0A3E0EV72_9FLAO|nr:porin family protein [Flavobacterium aquicola]REH02029.1 outer membrane protein with beta-barrel domain [Flavobacterium aquicola]